MSKRMVTYKVDNEDKIASIDGHAVGSAGDGDKSISRRMISYVVDDTGKIASIDGHELAGGGSGDYQIKELVVTENGVYNNAGEAYKPVRVNVQQAESGTVKSLLDATKSAANLFYGYTGTSVNGLISFDDTANVTTTDSMFQRCSNLTAIPTLDTSNVTNMSSMFYDCHALTEVPALDTSNVTNMESMFGYCGNLTTVPALDASKVDSMSGMFGFCSKLSSIGIYGFTRSVNITQTALKHDALVAFLNQAGTAYNSSQKITMGSYRLELLSDEEKAIATNKGWTLA